MHCGYRDFLSASSQPVALDDDDVGGGEGGRGEGVETL